MFRTRDFVLLFSSIMFLVMAIGTTLITQSWSQGVGAVMAVEPESDAQYVATVSQNRELDRAARIAEMRSKISQQATLSESVVEEEVVDEAVTDVATSTDELSDPQQVVTTCPNYRPYTTFWDARDLSLSTGEGAVILTRAAVAPAAAPEVVLQLPVRTLPSGNPSCLATDVIGIANDGSLIRNDEVSLYGIFSSETIIGYALDGFPIYGTGSAETDACGGVMTTNGYGYQLPTEGDAIITCFAATPALLP